MKNLKIGWLEDMTSRSEAEVFDEDCGGTRKNAISAGWTMLNIYTKGKSYRLLYKINKNNMMKVVTTVGFTGG